MSQLKVVGSVEEPTTGVDDLHIVRRRSLYERRIKRPVDFFGALSILLIFSPLFLGIAAMIRIKLGKGVFYEQERAGEHEQPFTIYKFRTMAHDRRQSQSDLPVVNDRRSTHKADDDPRHTGVGRVLRRFSLDELPQLINVIRGEMSLVGPRPEVYEIAQERGYLHHPRHEVKPGMTGPYQVSDLRLSGDLRDGLDADAEYVDQISMSRDLGYLVRTIGVMASGATGS